MKILNAMDGKKTATGGGLAAVTGLATAVCMIWEINSQVVDRVIDTVNLAAGFFGGVGIGHKAWKWFKGR